MGGLGQRVAYAGMGSGNMSVAPTPRLASASMSRSLDEGSDNGRNADLDSPFDLSLAR